MQSADKFTSFHFHIYEKKPLFATDFSFELHLITKNESLLKKITLI